MRKVLLGGAALAAAGILVAACDGGGGGGTFSLDDGTYDFTTREIPTDTCWPLSTTEPPLVGIPLPIDIDSTDDTTFTLTASGVASTFIPPITGTKDGNALSASVGAGNRLHISTACTLTISAGATGLMTADAEFDADINATLAVLGQNSAGTSASNCANAPTSIGGLVSFPALLRSNGACDLTLRGDAVLQ